MENTDRGKEKTTSTRQVHTERATPMHTGGLFTMGLTSDGDDAVQHMTHCVSQETGLPFSVPLRFAAVTMMMVALNHIAQSSKTSIAREGDDHVT